MKILLTTTVLILAKLSAISQQLPAEETALILDIQETAKTLKADFWPEWSSTPFSVLLLGDSLSYLINHPHPERLSSDQFTDSRFPQPIHFRKRNFPPNMAATFPLVDGTPVIVMGPIDKANFGKSRWAWTLLHEHFHQFQMSAPGYYDASKELDLAKDSTDFMWQLNYPFPYEQEEVKSIIDKMSQLLLDFMNTQDQSLKAEYVQAKQALKDAISEKDYRYYNFQVWQEGFPRFLEVELLKMQLAKEETTEANVLLEEYLSGIKEVLSDSKLDDRKRTIFYSVGAAEWFLIDQTNPDWQKTYMKKFFETDYLLAK